MMLVPLCIHRWLSAIDITVAEGLSLILFLSLVCQVHVLKHSTTIVSI